MTDVNVSSYDTQKAIKMFKHYARFLLIQQNITIIFSEATFLDLQQELYTT